jgi:hypothetical protein
VRRFILAFVVVLFWGLPLHAADSAQSDWRRFRAAYPYHIQTLALGAVQPAGRTLIVAEPPPAVTVAALQKTWPREFAAATIERHRLGVDGWVADIVTRLPPASEQATTELVQQLTAYLFGTSYKSYALAIGEPAAVPADNLDVAVSTGQLATWFGLRPPEPGGLSQFFDAMLGLAVLIAFAAMLKTRRMKWVVGSVLLLGVIAARARFDQPPPPDVLLIERHYTRPPRTLAQIMGGGGGLYDSERRGMVVFVLPRSASLNAYQQALREFALDTDVILGAVGTDRAIAIIGRERIVPASVMPPLRVETLLLLASVDSAELAQSYERRNLFAGRFDSQKNRDWAPIYLSAALKDTEYGSLLNITDQLLKSWSQQGEVRYANFPYPNPEKYPFPVRLSTHVRASTITFNWNTKGVGYSDEIGAFRMLAFARTGSLPVDYLGERDARLRDAEDTAYEYFASSRDPNLARVVQYAAAYQIFRAFGTSATSPYAVSPDLLDRPRLTIVAKGVLEMLRSDDAEQFANSVDSPEDRKTVQEFRSVVAALRAFHGRHGDRGDADLATALLEPRAWLARAERSHGDYDREVLELTQRVMDDQLVKAMCGDEVRQFALMTYLKGSTQIGNSWIHTPAVVISWNTGADAAEITGGHNLSSKVTRYVADRSVAPGDVRIVDGVNGRTIFYAAGDKARIHTTVRQAGRAAEDGPDVLRDALRQQLRRAQPRLGPVRQVLKLGDTPIAERGLGAHAGVNVSAATWTRHPGIRPAHEAALRTLERPGRIGIIVEREPDGIVMAVHGETSTIFAPDTPSAIDAFMARTNASEGALAVDVTFANFAPEQARGFLRSAQLHAPTGRRPQINAVVDGKGNAAVVADVRKTNWNVAAARIGTRPSSRAGVVLHTLEIPARRSGSPLRLIVEATAEATARVQALLTEFVAAMRTVSSVEELFGALRDLVAQVSLVPGVRKVQPLHVYEAGDVFIVRNGDMEPGDATD